MRELNGIPVYRVELDGEQEGIFDISLVDAPAVKKDFLLFSDKLNFSIQDNSKHIISGVIMEPDVPIYRRTEKLGEFYITFSREVIEQMVLKMSRENRFNNITLDHNEELIQGITLLEIFLKDSSRGINPTYLENVPDGSLLASYKVEDENLWDRIKSGEFKGFSLSGFFTAVPEPEAKKSSELDEILDLVNQLEAKWKQ